MALTAICPTNPSHKRFSTSAHVQQRWIVDEKGDFQEILEECVQVTHGPDADNTWSCIECGAEAIVIDN